LTISIGREVFEMAKSVTIRLDDEIYNKFHEIAAEENRSISNLIETLAFKNRRGAFYRYF
jgi:predicted CopG family antitoxin